jgi:hypothetical protein
MLKKAFGSLIGTKPKIAVVTIVLVANALIWFFYCFSFLLDIINGAGLSGPEIMAAWVTNFLGIALSAIFSFTLIYRFKRRITFLLYWMLTGAILSLTLSAITVAGLSSIILFSGVVGVYFGVGVPVCFGYFASATEPANRARLGGLTFFFSFLGFFLLSILGVTNIALNATILSLLKATGLVTIFFLKPEEKQINKSDKVSYGSIFKERAFFLYFIPWLMFSLVNSLAVPIISDSFTANFADYTLLSTVENALAAIFSVVFGFFGDFLGRKRLTVAGFSLLGLGYASLGLFPGSIFGAAFYVVADGIAWGALFNMFLLTLWGDLAQEKSSEKYYAIGSLPYLFSQFIRLSAGVAIGDMVPEFAVFSFASFFLFMAVLPLVYAPETLPEKTMKDRELKKYVEKAQKEAEKTQEKEAESTQRENEDAEVEFEVNQEDYEESLKEAEKYY